MKDVERLEDHNGQGGLHYRHGTQRLLQRLNQRTKGIDEPPYATGGTQGGQGKEKPKVLQVEDHLDYCGPKEGTNTGRRRYILLPLKEGKETNTDGTGKGNLDFRCNLEVGRPEDITEVDTPGGPTRTPDG